MVLHLVGRGRSAQSQTSSTFKVAAPLSSSSAGGGGGKGAPPFTAPTHIWSNSRLSELLTT
jgi:hypothetical protein